MAEREVIIVDPNAQARDQLVKDLKAYEKNPIDRSPKPGGYFLNADGSGAHDANGHPVELRSQDKAHADELARLAKARFSNQAEVETTALDSPEEVAERGPAEAGAAIRGVCTPPAVEDGQVMPDGSVSHADTSKKAKGKKK